MNSWRLVANNLPWWSLESSDCDQVIMQRFKESSGVLLSKQVLEG